MTSAVIWMPPWLQRPLEAICTWIPGYSGLLISDMMSYDLQGCLESAMASEATMASEAVGGDNQGCGFQI